MAEGPSEWATAAQPLEEHGTWMTSSLFQFYQPSPPQRIEMDIFFFHGLQPERSSDFHVSTWRSGGPSGEVWPKIWLPKIYPQARIISVAYDACIKKTETEGRMDLYLIGEALLQDILMVRTGQGRRCPVILVGHCFGGLVIKQLCVHAHRKKETMKDVITLIDSIAGVCFYGTPHRGMEGTLLGEMIGDMEPNQPLLDFLELLSTPASRMDEEFRKIQNCYRYKWRIHSLGELNPTALPGNRSTCDSCSYCFCRIWSPANGRTDAAVLVPEASSRLGEYISFHCDHFSICRPANEKCNRYLHLVALLDKVHQKQKETRRRYIQPDDFPVGVDALLSTILDQHLKRYTFLGLCGMGGVGKTTMAKIVFDELCAKFEYSCFVEDLKSIPGGKKEVKEEVWGNMHHHCMPLSSEGNHTANMWSQLTGKTLLIVFDDIDTREHSNLLKEIAQENGRAESRFITTSRDSGLLTELPHGRWYICDIPFLEDGEAKKLFMQYAFPSGEEPTGNLKTIVEEIVKGCSGLPLTLEVLGKFLGTTQDEKVWADIPQALSKADSVDCLEERVWSKLRVSFNNLGEQEQKMFLDFACTFSRADCHFTYAEVTYAWRSMYDCVYIRWQTLINMSLVKKVKRAYDEDQGWLDLEKRLPMRELFQMHEQLRSMGQKMAGNSGVKAYLLKEETKIPLRLPPSEKITTLIVGGRFGAAKRNTLRLPAASQIGSGNCSSATGPPSRTETGNCSSPDPCNLCRLQNILSKVEVRYLSLDVRHYFCEECSRSKNRSLVLPASSVMIRWLGQTPRLKSPEGSPIWTRLAVLKLVISEDWPPALAFSFGWEHLASLAYLSVSVDYKGYEGLMLRCFTIGYGKLRSLRHLHLESVDEKVSYGVESLSSLEYLRLAGDWCNRQSINLPQSVWVQFRCLRQLELEYVDFPSKLTHIGNLTRLEKLIIYSYKPLQELPESIGDLRSLKSLCLGEMPELRRLPESFTNLSSLEVLVLDFLGLEELPSAFGNLKNLKNLSIMHCYELKSLSETCGSLIRLQRVVIHRCPQLGKIPVTFMEKLSQLTHAHFEWISRRWQKGSVDDHDHVVSNIIHSHGTSDVPPNVRHRRNVGGTSAGH